MISRKLVILCFIILLMGCTACSKKSGEENNAARTSKQAYSSTTEEVGLFSKNEKEMAIEKYFDSLEQYDFNMLDESCFPYEMVQMVGMSNKYERRDLIKLVINNYYPIAPIITEADIISSVWERSLWIPATPTS